MKTCETCHQTIQSDPYREMSTDTLLQQQIQALSRSPIHRLKMWVKGTTAYLRYRSTIGSNIAELGGMFGKLLLGLVPILSVMWLVSFGIHWLGDFFIYGLFHSIAPRDWGVTWVSGFGILVVLGVAGTIVALLIRWAYELGNWLYDKWQVR